MPRAPCRSRRALGNSMVTGESPLTPQGRRRPPRCWTRSSPPTFHPSTTLETWQSAWPAKARLLRDGIAKAIGQESASGPLHDLLDAYRKVLINDLSSSDFADLQAQTAAYGLFAAWCRHQPASGPFTRQSAVFAETTPFLQNVFWQIAGPGIDQRIAWIVDDLARLLDRADMSAVLAHFGSGKTDEDPVVHFYEDFLAAYDPSLREMRGVYYTPEPVVSYIVRSVDRLLRAHFNLADGLAATDKITIDMPEGTQGREPASAHPGPCSGHRHVPPPGHSANPGDHRAEGSRRCLPGLRAGPPAAAPVWLRGAHGALRYMPPEPCPRDLRHRPRLRVAPLDSV